MSTFNRNTLALALAAALLPASAFAYDVNTRATAGDTPAQLLAPEPVAQQLGTNVTMTEAVGFTIALGDNIIGRTTGFGIKITLLDGAQFNAAMPATLTPTVGGALSGTWSINLAAGGAVNGSIVQYSAGPGAPGDFVKDGEITAIAALALKNVSTTGVTNMRVELIDPVSGNPLANGASTFNLTRAIIVRTDGLAFACTPTAVPNKVDVGTSVFAPTTKTAFVLGPTYTIGGASTFNAALGLVNVTTTGGFNLDVLDVPAPLSDTLTSKITGTDLSAFVGGTGSIFLGDATCATTYGAYTVTVPTTGVPTVANLNLSFNALNVAGAAFGIGGGSATLCVTAKGGTQQIEGQQFIVQNGINTTLEADPCSVSPIEFNGSTVKVFTFNPAGNTTQESFLRISSTGTTGGRVTITSRDDAGAAGASAVTFQLAAGKSIQLNSADLENGNVAKGLTGSFGAGAGKRRLVVTGEFDGMVVTSLNRNNTVGTLTNLTDADSRLEQVNDGK